ncbi:MAG: DUF418 domain-containing protein [Thermomonas sp.]
MSNEFKPIAASDRIHVLDVIRGFALLGIFMMNVEFFNRPLGEIGLGLPAAVAGIDHWAGWFVYVFVRGKFWTMFSLLFGMGFAVMLGRAEQAGRAFLGPYVRRTLALAVFGALHAIFIWSGDILFSYAMGAAILMIVLYTRPKTLLLIAGTCLGVAAMFAGLSAVMSGSPPWQPFAVIALPLLVLCAVAAALRRWPIKALRNAGLMLYLLPFLMMAVSGFMQMRQPPEPERDRIAQAAADTPVKQDALTKRLKERTEKRQEHEASVVEEARVMQGGSYIEAVTLRAREFVRHMGDNVAFSIIVLGMFLLGAWFIRSGVMAHPEQHLPLFRQLMWVGLPVGLGLTLVSAGIATTHVRGVNDSEYRMAIGLMMLGNLPACLGYVGALVLLWHGRARMLFAPFALAGRMALTHYIAQSVIGTLFFYGYGLAYWGMGRAWQLVFVLVVFALQVVFSRWWLARFRYGPLEWLWRWATYGQRPVMRLMDS